MVRVIVFAALGAASGAVAVELLDLLSDDQTILIFSPVIIIPGLIFGAVFGVALRRLGFVRTAGAVACVAASTLSHAVAIVVAVHLSLILEPVLKTFALHESGLNLGPSLGETAVYGVIGLVAGAAGGGLLAGATALLIRHLRWPLLIGAGAVLGAFLPLIDLGRSDRPFVSFVSFLMILFYTIWQSGYAATLAAILPRAAEKPARSRA